MMGALAGMGLLFLVIAVPAFTIAGLILWASYGRWWP